MALEISECARAARLPLCVAVRQPKWGLAEAPGSWVPDTEHFLRDPVLGILLTPDHVMLGRPLVSSTGQGFAGGAWVPRFSRLLQVQGEWAGGVYVPGPSGAPGQWSFRHRGQQLRWHISGGRAAPTLLFGGGGTAPASALAGETAHHTDPRGVFYFLTGLT